MSLKSGKKVQAGGLFCLFEKKVKDFMQLSDKNMGNCMIFNTLRMLLSLNKKAWRHKVSRPFYLECIFCIEA